MITSGTGFCAENASLINVIEPQFEKIHYRWFVDAFEGVPYTFSEKKLKKAWRMYKYMTLKAKVKAWASSFLGGN